MTYNLKQTEKLAEYLIENVWMPDTLQADIYNLKRELLKAEQNGLFRMLNTLDSYIKEVQPSLLDSSQAERKQARAELKKLEAEVKRIETRVLEIKAELESL